MLVSHELPRLVIISLAGESGRLALPGRGGWVRVALKIAKPLTSVLSPWVRGRGDKGQCLGSKLVEVDAIIMTHSKIRERRQLSPSYCNQFVNSKFGRRLDGLCVVGQVRNEFWIRLRPPKSIPGENKMRGSSAPQPLKILDCLLAVVWSAVVNRVILGKMPALALSIVKDGRMAHVRGYDQCIGRCHSFQLQTGIAKLRRR